MIYREVGVYFRITQADEIQRGAKRLSALSLERDGVQAAPHGTSVPGVPSMFELRTRLEAIELCELLDRKKLSHLIGLNWSPSWS